MRKLPPGPWKLTFQTSPKGRRSRFTIEDADGKKIARVYNEAAAILLARAFEMFAVLRPLADKAKSFELILCKEFEHNVAEPIIEEARRLEDGIRGIELPKEKTSGVARTR